MKLNETLVTSCYPPTPPKALNLVFFSPSLRLLCELWIRLKLLSSEGHAESACAMS